ncbi:MAG TPA: pyridoxamine 5'-phosphate oxidase family protein [Candidatus Angelobacter sp.]|jgi:hypothetical protein|nr:pyridoxamine 5'-phosphate oxidase family protein [Candidatus Angelobacter sp.]
MASPLDRPDVATVLNSQPYAAVAVDTVRGPHITPAAFATAGGRLWVVSSRRTIRVRSVRRRHHAAVLVRSGTRAVVVSGRAEVLSFWPPSETVGIVMNSLPVARAATAYALRNARLLLGGFVRDVVSGTGDLSVYDRVLVAIEPERGMLLDGERLVHGWGRWHRASTREPRADATNVPPLAQLLAALPDGVDAALDVPESASLGWSSPAGAVALPTLHADPGGRVQVATAALDMVSGATRAPACVTFHNSESERPSGFRGVVLRGEGRVVRRGAARTTVDVAAERVSWWSGFRAGTSTAAA